MTAPLWQAIWTLRVISRICMFYFCCKTLIITGGTCSHRCSTEQRAVKTREDTAGTVRRARLRLSYLTLGRWQSICRYFWGRSWRSPPSSLCRRAAAALHQTRSIYSRTQLACSAYLPRSRPSSKGAAKKRAHTHARNTFIQPEQQQQQKKRRQMTRLMMRLTWNVARVGMARALNDAQRGRTSWARANHAGEKWCNARARGSASGPLFTRVRGCARGGRILLHYITQTYTLQ